MSGNLTRRRRESVTVAPLGERHSGVEHRSESGGNAKLCHNWAQPECSEQQEALWATDLRGTGAWSRGVLRHAEKLLSI